MENIVNKKEFDTCEEHLNDDFLPPDNSCIFVPNRNQNEDLKASLMSHHVIEQVRNVGVLKFDIN